jgi:UDP-glucose 4-epimerase
MKIAITGGAGFIASHVADAYIADGHEVHVLDDFSTGREANVNAKAIVHRVDVAEPEAARLLRQIRPDLLNHHAAQMDVRHSVADPAFDARVNIIGFVNLLQACSEAGVKKVIFASSGGAVYGDKEPIPSAEDHPTEPMSPYGVSKRAGELYLGYYHSVFGLPYVALRYANVYGPRQSSKGEAGVVAIFIDRLLSGEAPIINGDGRQTRDYVFVEDVVAANMAATRAGFVGAVNIGTAKETDVVTICRLLRAGLQSKIEATHGPAKPGEQRRSCLATGLAARVLGWTPAMSLEEGLQKTIGSWSQTGAR